MSARDEERQHLNGWLGRCLPRPGRRPAAVPAYQEALAQGKLPRLSGFARALASRPADRVPSAARRRFQGGDLPGASRPAAFRKSSPGPPRARHGGHHGRRRDQAVARRLLDGRRGRAGGPWACAACKGQVGLEGARATWNRAGAPDLGLSCWPSAPSQPRRAVLAGAQGPRLMRALLPESGARRRAAAVHLDQAQYAEAAARLLTRRWRQMTPGSTRNSRVFASRATCPRRATFLSRRPAFWRRNRKLAPADGPPPGLGRRLCGSGRRCLRERFRRTALVLDGLHSLTAGRYAAARARFLGSLRKLALMDWARKASHTP